MDMCVNQFETELLRQPQLRRLLGAAAGRQGIAHAHLLSGPDGSGLLRAALMLACTLKCPEAEGIPCGNCIECRRVEQGNHPDIHVVLPQGDTVKLAQVRGLQSTLHMKSNEGGDKVGIVAHSDRMSPEAANSLLKTLEDPPPQTLLILTARNVGRLPPTVVSRCQEVRMLPLAPQVLAERLMTGDADERAVRLVARLCQGDEELAQRWLERGDILELRDELVRELGSLAQLDPLTLAQAWEKRSKEDKDVLSLQIEMGLILLRDALMFATGSHASGDDEDSDEFLSGLFGQEGLLACIRIMLKTQDYIRSNVNVRLALDAMFLALRGVKENAASSGNPLQKGG